MAGPDERIDIEVELENNLSRPAKVAEKSLDRLGDEATEVAGQMALLDEKMEDVSQQAMVLGAQAKFAQGTLDGMGDSAKFSGKSMADSATDIDDYTKSTNKATKSMDRSIKSMLRLTRITKLFRFALKGLVIGAVIDGITMLVTALQGLSAALVAAVNGIARLSGVLGALPSLYASVAQGAVTFKIGVKGMGDALAALGDPDATLGEINKAMRDLAPSARKVVYELFALKGGWEVLQRNVQQNLFAGLSDDVRVLGAKYLPIIREGLAATATQLNRVMEYTSQWLQQKSSMNTVGDVMGDNAFIAGRLGMMFSRLFQATLHFMDAAGPMARRMSSDLAEWARRVSNLVQNNKKGIGTWLMGSYENWLKTKEVLVDFGVAFFNIFKAASPMADWMGRNIARIGREFRAWTESKEGRRSIADWFKDMRPIVRELALWVRDLSKFFAGIAMDPKKFVPISKQMREDLLPALEKIFDAMSGNVLPAIVELFEAFGELADAGLLEVFAKALLIFAKALKAIAWAFNKMPDWAQNIIIWGGAIALLGRSRVMRALFGMIGKTGILTRFGTKLAGLLRGPMATFAGWFEKTFGAKALSRMKAFLGPLGRVLGKMAAFAAPGLLMGAVPGKGSKNSPTSKTGIPPVVATGPGGDTSKKGGKFRRGLGGAGGFLKSNALWGLGFFGLEGSIREGMQAQQSHQAEAAASSSKSVAQMYEILKKSNVGKNAEELDINLKKLATEIQRKGLTGDYYRKVEAKLDALDNRDWKDWVIGDLKPWEESGRHKAGASLDALRGIASNRYGEMISGQGKGIGSSKDVASLIDPLGRLSRKFEMVTGVARKYRGEIASMPTEVATAIAQPGMIQSIQDIIDLGLQYNLTPKQVKTLIRALGGKEAMDAIRGPQRSLDNFEGTYTAQLRLKAQIADAVNSVTDLITFGGGRFAGGQIQANMPYTVGEMGPEAFISKSGKIGMVGEHGPEMRKFGSSGAIIPSSGTFDPAGGNMGNAPGWAVNAFRRATEDGMGQLAVKQAPAPQGDAEEVHYHYHQNGDVHNAQPIDMQREFKKAFKAIERDRKERR